MTSKSISNIPVLKRKAAFEAWYKGKYGVDPLDSCCWHPDRENYTVLTQVNTHWEAWNAGLESGWTACLDRVDAEMEGHEFSNADRACIQDALGVRNQRLGW